MKKLFSLFLMMLVILVSFGNSTPVFAIDEEKPKIFEIMFGAVAQSNGSQYRSVYAIRQSWFKNQNNPEAKPSQLDDSEHVSNTICDYNKHYDSTWAEQQIREDICNDTQMRGSYILNSTLASFSLFSNGDLTVALSPNVSINRLNIYYSIAGKAASNSRSILLYCENNAICDRAKLINSSNTSKSGNWVSDSKHYNQGMSFTHSEMERYGFSYKENSIGTTIFDGYNVIDNMSRDAKDLAEKHGAYVIVTLSISYEQKTYYINTPITTMNNRPEFSGVAHITSSSDSSSVKTYSNVLLNPQTINADGDSNYLARMNSMGMHVDKYAGLVSKLAHEEKNQGIADTLELFDKTIKPIIMIGLGILLIVKGTMLIMTIIKSSDEPEVRRDSIKHLVTLFVSVFVIMMIVWYMKPIVEIMQELLNEAK